MRHPSGFRKRFPMTRRLILGLVCLFSATSLWSQTPDLKGWAGFEVKRNYRKGFDISAQVQTRWENKLAHFRGNYFSISPSYKLKKNRYLLAETRYATSTRWDKFRFGTGIVGKHDFGKLDFALKFRYQHEFYLQAWPEIGQNPAKDNFRLKLSAEYKLHKRLDLGLSVEPVYLLEARIGSLKWIRNTIKLDWEFTKRHHIEFAYFYQPTFDELEVDQNHVLAFNYAWELRKQKKKKNRK